MINFLWWFLCIICIGILFSFIGGLFICPILYWIGAILDDFNCSAFNNGKWWFDKRNNTIKEFIADRHLTDGYENYCSIKWIPIFGIFGQLIWFIVVLLGTIGTFTILFIKYIIIPLSYNIIWKYILKPIYKLIFKIFNLNIVKTIIYTIKKYNDKIVKKILNIKLH